MCAANICSLAHGPIRKCIQQTCNVVLARPCQSGDYGSNMIIFQNDNSAQIPSGQYISFECTPCVLANLVFWRDADTGV